MSKIDISFIAKQLGKAAQNGTGWVCCCPSHADLFPSLSLALAKDSNIILAYCHAGCSFDDIMKELKNRGLLSPSTNWFQECPTFSSKSNNLNNSKDKTLQASQIWQRCHCADVTLVEAYLMSRGINISVPITIKHHPYLYHAPTRQYFPAMVSAVSIWPNRTISGIHRTYLTHNGTNKAEVNPNKMMLGVTKGGAVRLTPPGPHLILAEGIETALSVYEATGIPTWATLSTSGMTNIVVPPLEITQEITIAADNDRAGLNAAEKLGKRLLKEGYIVRISKPPLGQDFNDMLRGAK